MSTNPLIFREYIETFNGLTEFSNETRCAITGHSFNSLYQSNYFDTKNARYYFALVETAGCKNKFCDFSALANKLKDKDSFLNSEEGYAYNRIQIIAINRFQIVLPLESCDSMNTFKDACFKYDSTSRQIVQKNAAEVRSGAFVGIALLRVALCFNTGAGVFGIGENLFKLFTDNNNSTRERDAEKDQLFDVKDLEKIAFTTSISVLSAVVTSSSIPLAIGSNLLSEIPVAISLIARHFFSSLGKT